MFCAFDIFWSKTEGALNFSHIDPKFNSVEVTDEAKAELAKIENKIGDYICKLCKEIYEDTFGLAQHRYILFSCTVHTQN